MSDFMKAILKDEETVLGLDNQESENKSLDVVNEKEGVVLFESDSELDEDENPIDVPGIDVCW